MQSIASRGVRWCHGAILAMYAMLLAGTLLAGCTNSSVMRTESGEPVSSAEPYDGPAITVDVLTQRMLDEPEHVVVVELTAPTGGYEFALDEAHLIEETTESDESPDEPTLRLFATLDAPAEGEMVTQALVMHHITHRSSASFSAVEVYVRINRRGEHAGEYRLAWE